MSALDADAIRRRYLALIALRWLPAGFLGPIIMLIPVSRGLSLAELGLAFSVQGFVVLVLELPTGGLADSLGRRPVLLLASLFSLASVGLLFVADTMALFALAAFLQGVYRALDSGPLEAWYVDATHEVDPSFEIERGLSAGTAVLSVAIALGALTSGALVALHPIPALAPIDLPILVSLGLGVVNLIGLALLMIEHRPVRGLGAITASVRATPRTIGEGLGLLRSSRVLLAIVLVELFWSTGMVAFESLFPIRLAEVIGDTDQAAAAMGPVSSAAWFAAAAGAAGITLFTRRIGVALAAALLRVLQGLTIVAMGLLAGVVGLIAAYLASYAIHGASNPMHSTLLHREVDAAHRTTVVSINSMAGFFAFSIGLIALTALADATSLTVAMVVAGIACALAAPLYLPARRAELGVGRRAAESRSSR
jgi:MFS family permease